MSDQSDSGRVRRTPKGRVYVHDRCGGQTMVSGGDYTHLCDPFRPCMSTFCCTCGDFAALDEVRWADTGEGLSDFRDRLRAETPGLVRAWRYGVGFLVGLPVGALAGLLVETAADLPRDRRGVGLLVGGLVGGLVVYVAGAIALNRVFGIDYRRMH